MREDDLARITNANAQIAGALVFLGFALFNTAKIIKHARKVAVNSETGFEAAAGSPDAKAALESMVETYSEMVN